MRSHGPRRTRHHRGQRGSALLVTLMVMVGLSLLGLGFVAISETESTISVNERNYAQALSVAESGARLVVEWFQDPTWANARGLLPPNDNTIKRLRVLPAGPLAGYSGRYKSDTSTGNPTGFLFDKPFKPRAQDRFFGSENTPDVLIDSSTVVGTNFLNTFNTALLQDGTNGQVTEIRLYAPPIVNGTLNAQGFWEQGTRYGLCTIRVMARKFVGNQQVAERTVKLVISEWPFPGPQGPVQSNANISTGGNFGVHWGKMTSDKQMEIKRPLVGLPWNDPWDRIHFEHGYWEGCNVPLSPCKAFSTATLAPASMGAGSGFDSNFNQNGGPWCDKYDWLYKVEDVAFEDPWYEARAKTQITNAIVAGIPDPQPYKFNDINYDITANGPGTFWGFSNWFQTQNFDDTGLPCGGSDHKLVIFPKIDYNFWKNLSQSASSTITGVSYLRWVGPGEEYTDGITTQIFAKWVNTARATNPAKAGFYFFDTQNGLNPQGAAPPGVLAPGITVNASDDGPTFKMKGFFYLNTQVFGTTGIGGPTAYDNFPGEPYRDIGYRRVCDATANCIIPLGALPWAYDTTNPPVGANDGEFSFQDLNGNGVCDIFLVQRPVTFPTTVPGPRNITEYFPVPWYPGCIPGFNGAAGANCSEPHEPFLNLVYTSKVGSNPLIAEACCSGGGAPSLLTAKWEDPSAFTKQTKQKSTTTGNPVACNAAALIAPAVCNPSTGLVCTNVPDPNCTSNGYDRDGPLQQSFGSPNSEPIMDGVLYNEGDYDTQGNAAYFGSILINGNIIGTGSPEVWFDEFLIKGGWQDKFRDLPRVYITSHETDQ